MQVILLAHIGGLGKLGDLVTVKNGYARNFLIPQRKAQRATPANLAAFEEKRAEYEATQASILTKAEADKQKLDGQNISISQKAGVDGRLFGSVTSHDIADSIQSLGVEVNKSNVRLPNGPLKAIGEYEVEVALYSDIVANVTVSIIPASE